MILPLRKISTPELGNPVIDSNMTLLTIARAVAANVRVAVLLNIIHGVDNILPLNRLVATAIGSVLHITGSLAEFLVVFVSGSGIDAVSCFIAVTRNQGKCCTGTIAARKKKTKSQSFRYK